MDYIVERAALWRENGEQVVLVRVPAGIAARPEDRMSCTCWEYWRDGVCEHIRQYLKSEVVQAAVEWKPVIIRVTGWTAPGFRPLVTEQRVVTLSDRVKQREVARLATVLAALSNHRLDELNRRVEVATRDAETTFWEVIASHFREITTYPEVVQRDKWRRTLEKHVREWALKNQKGG